MAYNRVNWEDGTQIEGAYVEIDDTRYPVVMPEYTGNTPIDATNLNIMDAGIKEVSDSVEQEEIPITVESGIQQLQAIKMYKFGRMYSITGGVSKNWSTPSDNYKKLFKIPTEYIPTGVFIIPVVAVKVGVGTVTYDNAKTHIRLIQDGNNYYICLYDNGLTTAETVYFDICYMK